jgi:nucleoside-diphosphate-sugar epimerase
VSTVVVTGAQGSVGRRVVALLEADPDVERIVGVDVVAPPPAPVGGTGGPDGRVVHHVADLASDDLQQAVVDERPDVIVHLAFSWDEALDEDGAARANVEAARRLLDAAAKAGARQVIGVSSATVYGAWSSNPVPLTEDAPLRPDPGFGFAVQHAEVERLLAEWADAHPSTEVAVLRPTVAVAEEGNTFLARSLAAAAGLRIADPDPPVQFVHLDDVGAAVDLVRRHGLHGVFNVAPDGWVPGDTARALAGATARPRLPASIATRLARWGWTLRVGPVPPGLLAYTAQPWVIANDRLKAAGWVPSSTNEEAFVAGHPGSRWSTVSPQRRQELALGATAVLGLGLLGGVLAGVRALVRRRRLASAAGAATGG